MPLRPGPAWLGGALALTLAIGSGVLLAQLLMSPPAGDLRELAAYLTLSGAATMAAGWLALGIADRAAALSIQTKAFLSSAIGTGVALLNVLIVAELMFISTAHDLKLLIALLVFSAVITLFFSLWVASSVAGRIAVVAGGIRALAAGDYGRRVEVAGGDEVARLAADVNELAARLQTIDEERRLLDQERRELTAAISHDLRTPLASVRAMVEALDDEVVDNPAEVSRYYTTIRREIDRLSRMIDDLFELAQLDAGALRLERRPIALREVAIDVVDAMQAQARSLGVTVEARVEDGATELELDGARMERAVANLVRNALEHTAVGGRVEVRVGTNNGWAELSVADSGEGIAAEELPHVWQRFYRAEKSRKRDENGADGAGLGLAIVRGIVEAHGGAVDVDSTPGRGSTFVIRLPNG